MESSLPEKKMFSTESLEKKRWPIHWGVSASIVMLLCIIAIWIMYSEQKEITLPIKLLIACAVPQAVIMLLQLSVLEKLKDVRDTCIKSLEYVEKVVKLVKLENIIEEYREAGVVLQENEVQDIARKLAGSPSVEDIQRLIRIAKACPLKRVHMVDWKSVHAEMSKLDLLQVQPFVNVWLGILKELGSVENEMRVVTNEMERTLSGFSPEFLRGMSEDIQATNREIDENSKRLRARYIQGNFSLTEARAFYKEVSDKIVVPRQRINEHIDYIDGIMPVRKGQ